MRAPAADAFHRLVRTLAERDGQGRHSSFLTSTRSSDEKTMVAINLAATFVTTGRDVILVDGDPLEAVLSRSLEPRARRGNGARRERWTAPHRGSDAAGRAPGRPRAASGARPPGPPQPVARVGRHAPSGDGAAAGCGDSRRPDPGRDGETRSRSPSASGPSSWSSAATGRATSSSPSSSTSSSKTGSSRTASSSSSDDTGPPRSLSRVRDLWIRLDRRRRVDRDLLESMNDRLVHWFDRHAGTATDHAFA